eukprot:SAG31_NODE_1955_length_6823_cov_2.519780_1_plen_70_part_00
MMQPTRPARRGLYVRRPPRPTPPAAAASQLLLLLAAIAGGAADGEMARSSRPRKALAQYDQVLIGINWD